MKTDVKCPYCGVANVVSSMLANETQVLYCDCEIGGCDKRFVVDTHMEIKAKVYKITEV